MKHKLFFLGLAFAVVLLAGCTSIPEEELYNNTGSDIIITRYTLISDDTYRFLTNEPPAIPPKINKIKIQNGNYTYNYEVENTFILKSDQSAVIGVAYKTKIQKGNQTYYYDPKWFPFQFWGSNGFNKRLAKFQIQEDGSIYILMPNSAVPVKDFPPQPKDYPLEPKTN